MASLEDHEARLRALEAGQTKTNEAILKLKSAQEATNQQLFGTPGRRGDTGLGAFARLEASMAQMGESLRADLGRTSRDLEHQVADVKDSLTDQVEAIKQTVEQHWDVEKQKRSRFSNIKVQVITFTLVGILVAVATYLLALAPRP
jgi:hypothetical protein